MPNGTGAYMRYKKMAGISLARAKLLVNDGSLQQPKAIGNFFDYTDVNLVPYGYGIYGPKLDHFELTNVLLHGNETNFYSADCWMSRLNTVWLEGGTSLVIETGTSVTANAVWSSNASWNTYDTLGNLIKKHYAFDVGGHYHNFANCACDYAGADGRPTQSIWNIRRESVSINMSAVGAEFVHARYFISTTPGGSAFQETFVNINSISVASFYNKYGDASLAGKRRVLFDVTDFCNVKFGTGKFVTVYPDTTLAPQKPHIAYVGKKARLNLGSVHFFGDTIKGVQLNDAPFFTAQSSTTGTIPTVAVTQSEVWVDSDTFQASAFEISNGILDIKVSGSNSDIMWDAGSTASIGSLSYRYGGYCGRATSGDLVQLRAQNGNRAVSLIVSGTAGGLFDYSVNDWILKIEQGTGESLLNIGSKLTSQDASINFRTAGNGAAFNSRLIARTSSGSHYIYAQGNFLAPFADNATNLGGAAARWIAVYAVNGSIQTSDGTKKINKKSIDDAVLDAWDEVEFYQYQWKDEEVKDADGVSHGMRHDPRTHYGVIAQEIVAAFERHGVNALDTGVVTFENDEYGVSYTSAMVLEMACMRRKLKALN